MSEHKTWLMKTHWDELDWLGNPKEEENKSTMTTNLKKSFDSSMEQKKKVLSKKDAAKKEYYRLLNNYGDSGLAEVIVSYDEWNACRVELVCSRFLNSREIARKLTELHNKAFPHDKKSFHTLAIKEHYYYN